MLAVSTNFVDKRTYVPKTADIINIVSGLSFKFTQ